MEQGVLAESLRTVALVIGLTLLWTVPLGLFLYFVQRRRAQSERDVQGTWLRVGQELGSSMSPPARVSGGIEMKGKYRDRPMRVYGSFGRAKSGQPSTSVTTALNLQADVYFLATQTKNIGMDYTPADDPELDQKYRFQSRPPSLLLSIATDAAIHRMLIEGKILQISLTPYEVFCLVSEIEADENHLKLMIQLVNDVADKAAALIGSTIPTGQPLNRDAYFYQGITLNLKGTRGIVFVAGLMILLILSAAALVFLASNLFNSM